MHDPDELVARIDIAFGCSQRDALDGDHRVEGRRVKRARPLALLRPRAALASRELALLREGQQEHGGEEQARLEVGAAVHAAVGAWGVRGERATVTGGHPPWLTHFTPSRTRVRARSLLRCPWLLAIGHRATANRNTLNGTMQRHRRRRPKLTCRVSESL